MKRKIKARKARKRSAARPRQKRVQPAAYPNYEEINYEGALARSVMDHAASLENEDAVALAAGLSSLTESLKRLSYNYGLSVGRSVYRLFEGRKHYRWYGDSIQDLVLFFERLGYRYIKYKILTDDIELIVYRKNRAGMGCSVHSFDAGLMAGFLGAGRGDFVRVTEVSCCNNGGEFCRFTTAPVPEDPFCSDIKTISNMFGSAKSEGMVRQEYQVLVTGPLMNAAYSDQMATIISHLGRQAMGPGKGRISAKVAKKAGDIMERFGFGKLGYAAKQQKVEILLDGAKAKKEFVDISISFLNGMLGGYFSGTLRPKLSAGRRGSYKITMKQ
ncbi:MAG: hypothetical protein KGH94_01360 [Candidatus Micrarchaeota archaeon]|nr:hypothetical protein [Candidatus Micrarchaeota archaeon]